MLPENIDSVSEQSGAIRRCWAGVVLNYNGIVMNKIESKWLQNKWLILTSLLLNLFLIGSIAGGAYKLIENHQAAKAGQNALRFAAGNLS